MPAAGGGKPLWGWALYDFANSAFATTVLAGFFPVFFRQYWSAGADPAESTALLGLGNSLAGLLVALSAPFLSDEQRLNVLFLAAYSREPNTEELESYTQFLENAPAEQQAAALGDVLWVLANSAEFMLNH